MEEQDETAELDNLLRICASQYCRTVVAYLQESSDTSASLSDIIDDLQTETHERRRWVAVHVHHSTLPRLEEIGYLEYDKQSNLIRYCGHPELEELVACVKRITED